jgi:hypothetical protein
LDYSGGGGVLEIKYPRVGRVKGLARNYEPHSIHINGPLTFGHPSIVKSILFVPSTYSIIVIFDLLQGSGSKNVHPTLTLGVRKIPYLTCWRACSALINHRYFLKASRLVIPESIKASLTVQWLFFCNDRATSC